MHKRHKTKSQCNKEAMQQRQKKKKKMQQNQIQWRHTTDVNQALYFLLLHLLLQDDLIWQRIFYFSRNSSEPLSKSMNFFVFRKNIFLFVCFIHTKTQYFSCFYHKNNVNVKQCCAFFKGWRQTLIGQWEIDPCWRLQTPAQRPLWNIQVWCWLFIDWIPKTVWASFVNKIFL